MNRGESVDAALCPQLSIRVGRKMERTALKRIYGSLLLLILLAAYGGQEVHIYREDPLHFAAWAGDLVPDNGAHERVSELCIVDDFHFFPHLGEVLTAPSFRTEILAVLLPEATRCKAGAEVRLFSLRAPPVRL